MKSNEVLTFCVVYVETVTAKCSLLQHQMQVLTSLSCFKRHELVRIDGFCHGTNEPAHNLLAKTYPPLPGRLCFSHVIY